MRDGVRIVNAARGDLIDDAALIRALESGKVAGAALDVFVEEPYSGPLLTAPNVVLTPHLAASTDEAQDRAGVIVAEQVVGRAAGRARHVRREHPDDRRRGSRGARPVRAARREARPARDGARNRRGAAAAARLLGRPLRVRHPPAHGRGPERRLRGANRPARQLRERAADRGRARRRGRRGQAQLVARLPEPRRRCAADGATVAGTTIGQENRQWLVEALGYQLEIELAPQDGAAALRRRARA